MKSVWPDRTKPGTQQVRLTLLDSSLQSYFFQVKVDKGYRVVHLKALIGTRYLGRLITATKTLIRRFCLMMISVTLLTPAAVDMTTTAICKSETDVIISLILPYDVYSKSGLLDLICMECGFLFGGEIVAHHLLLSN